MVEMAVLVVVVGIVATQRWTMAALVPPDKEMLAVAMALKTLAHIPLAVVAVLRLPEMHRQTTQQAARVEME